MVRLHLRGARVNRDMEAREVTGPITEEREARTMGTGKAREAGYLDLARRIGHGAQAQLSGRIRGEHLSIRSGRLDWARALRQLRRQPQHLGWHIALVPTHGERGASRQDGDNRITRRQDGDNLLALGHHK